MKLGKDTANLNNWMMGGCKQANFTIQDVKEGMDVTFLMWTDRTTGIVRQVDTYAGYVVVEEYEDCYDRLDEGDPKRNETRGSFVILKYARNRWYEVKAKGEYYDYENHKRVQYGEELKKVNLIFGVRDGYYCMEI